MKPPETDKVGVHSAGAGSAALNGGPSGAKGCEGGRGVSFAQMKLMAADPEDLSVIAALLQDSILPVSDMIYFPAQKNFIMVVQRFKWDEAPLDQSGNDQTSQPLRGAESSVPEGSVVNHGVDCCYARICCALNIWGVEEVKISGFSQKEFSRMLELLHIEMEANALTFVFAGEARLKLFVNNWKLFVEDFGVSWPTKKLPCHNLF